MTVYAVASDCTQYIKERLADLKFGMLLISPVVIVRCGSSSQVGIEQSYKLLNTCTKRALHTVGI